MMKSLGKKSLGCDKGKQWKKKKYKGNYRLQEKQNNKKAIVWVRSM